MKSPRAAIGGVGNPLDEATLFEPIDDPRERDRLDVEQVGEFDLSHAGLARQPKQHLPLRAGNSVRTGTAIERLPQRMAGFANLKGKSFHPQPI